MVQSKLLVRQSSGTEGAQVWCCPGRTEGGKSTTEGIVEELSVRESQKSPVSMAMASDTCPAAAPGQVFS